MNKKGYFARKTSQIKIYNIVNKIKAMKRTNHVSSGHELQSFRGYTIARKHYRRTVEGIVGVT